MAKGIKSLVDYSGTDAKLINVECHITNGLPGIVIIGYASKAVDEAKERLRASFTSCSIPLPRKRITLNLAPADIPKDATSLDLAMAVAILTQSQQVPASSRDWVFFGELSLDGSVNPVHGLVGRLLTARKKGYTKFFLPTENESQAFLVPGIEIKTVDTLKDVFLDLCGDLKLSAKHTGQGSITLAAHDTEALDLSEISGQSLAKRALEIAAAGHHNVLLHGPPGTGKTMLAKAMCSILPPLEHSEVLEVTQLHSLSSGDFNTIVTKRPFRSPHHTSSTISIIGGGASPKPGEASLAHRGVLFLDELPEFARSSLEALRQPLEDGVVSVARIKESVVYPARFILIATQNPCPCGYYGTSKPCVCTAAAIAKYQKKVSGPILDRIDIHLPVIEVNHAKLLDNVERTSESQPAKARVIRAYEHQMSRFGKTRFNSSMSHKEVRQLAGLSSEAKKFLDEAAKKLDISARAYVRSVKVARTIADLEGAKDIKTEHLSEALRYRYQPTFT